MSYKHEFDEFEKMIIDGYPQWFDYDDFYWGFDISDGWRQLIKEMCEQLSKIDTPEDYGFYCIKQKYGFLTIYDINGNEETTKIVNSITSRAEGICELCGGTDGVKTGGSGWWVTTECRICRETDDVPNQMSKHSMKAGPYDVTFYGPKEKNEISKD